jgi:16S rRNA (guanine(966)-N(2))-methyltransferase RsmD
LRIISGTHKGRHLYPPKNFRARPTTDTAKESLFNILTNHFDLEKVKVLDLFSGTGGIGFEFASRGCIEAHLVEKNRNHIKFIHKVISEFKFDQVKVYQTDAFRAIRNTPEHYDLIFADPPYDLPGLEKIPDMIFEYSLLNKNGRFILEHSSKHNFSGHPHFTEHRNYGSVHFSFFE